MNYNIEILFYCNQKRLQNENAINNSCRKERYTVDLKPLKVSGIQFTTNNNKQSVASYNQAKQTSDNYKLTFNDLLKDLMMEQREQM
jgi:hypothetical protein